MDLATSTQKNITSEIENRHSSLIHGTTSKVGHNLDPKPSFNKYKTIEIIPVLIPDYSYMKLEINKRLISDMTQILGDQTIGF